MIKQLTENEEIYKLPLADGTVLWGVSAAKSILPWLNELIKIMQWENYFDKLDKKSRADMRIRIFNSACDVAGYIHCYTLQATINGKFWEGDLVNGKI